MWKWNGSRRPPWAETPGPGRESVWDYPRPPGVEPVARTLVVAHGGRTVARTSRGRRVVETAGAPVYYFPPEDVDASLLVPAAGRSHCEWKGTARYWDVVVDGARVPDAAWSYPDPSPAFAVLRGHFAFYAGKLDRCLVGGVVAEPQPGGFYGGWVTPDLAGPIKGAPGSHGW